MQLLTDIAQLEDQLSMPTPGVLETLSSVPGDVMVLGAAGKMGPTLTRMVRRALDQLGQRERRVFAASSSWARTDTLALRMRTIDAAVTTSM